MWHLPGAAEGDRQEELTGSPWNIGSFACLEGIGVYPAKNWHPEAVPMDKLSVEQFVHTLAFLASRCELRDVTRSMRANSLCRINLRKKLNCSKLDGDRGHFP